MAGRVLSRPGIPALRNCRTVNRMACTPVVVLCYIAQLTCKRDHPGQAWLNPVIPQKDRPLPGGGVAKLKRDPLKEDSPLLEGREAGHMRSPRTRHIIAKILKDDEKT